MWLPKVIQIINWAPTLHQRFLPYISNCKNLKSTQLCNFPSMQLYKSWHLLLCCLKTLIKRTGGSSRWHRSKTWRSPSSPQIHQKYIYMWNNSYRTPTECWQKTSDLPKGKKIPTYLGRAKEKRKKQTQKNRDGTCTSRRELWRRKSFHTLGSPFTGGAGGWAGGSFRAMEESAATGVQRAKWSNFHTEDLCQSALTSLRGLSAYPPGRVGAGSWGLGFGDQIPGTWLGLAAWTQPEGG